MASARPQPGDLIEVFCIDYAHWAIYVGDGYVIHLVPQGDYPGAGSSRVLSVLSSRAVVKRERLEAVGGSCSYHVNNLLDSEYKPRPVEVIMNDAKTKLGEEVEYRIMKRNCEHFLTNLRYGVPECRQARPQPGDLIEIFRIDYAHWAIYVGDGYVIHLAPQGEYPEVGSSSISSVLSSRAVVKRERLEAVVGNCSYRVNNLLDSKYRPRPVKVIINDAKAKLGEEVEYNIPKRNCEHFVTNLRYGVPECRQAGPQPGDLIEITRIGYAHWAIYVGDGYVIHLVPTSDYPGAGSSSAFSALTSRAVVKRERLEAVVGSCSYRVNNLLDSKYRPRPVKVIINDAEAIVREEVEYSVLRRNCEHFVTNLRYGVPQCRQVQNFMWKVYNALGLGLRLHQILRFE